MNDYWKQNKTYIRDGILTFCILAPIVGILMNLAYHFTDRTFFSETTVTNQPDNLPDTYLQIGAEIDTSLFSEQLPPPPLDALPYDVRTPLDNGEDVSLKRRWLWIPDGETIQIFDDATGQTRVVIPEGAMWWKEFYLTTDTGTFLIERRIILRSHTGAIEDNDGWLYFAAYHRGSPLQSDQALILLSTAQQATQFQFAPQDWLPTQLANDMLEVRFEGAQGEDYRYVFPGMGQCTACHNGATGAYPNPIDDPIRVFGLHPNNLTEASLQALVERGWIENENALSISTTGIDADDADYSELPVDDLTPLIVAEFRNNCASCHNPSPDALASFTGFIIDSNQPYTTSELSDVLTRQGIMFGSETFPIVSTGSPDESEIMLRLQGEQGRRRMPPIEGGVPEINEDLLVLLTRWIELLPTD